VTAKTSRKIFVNLPVRELKRSVEFFTRLGFGFDPQFTDHKATCMIVSEEAFVMLLEADRFSDFTRRPLADAHKVTEALFAISAESRAEVDKLADAALAGGGTQAMPPQDHGFMYQRSFYDLDGHHWEVLHMDLAAFQAAQKK
jgi:uncharacterized protein